MKKLLVLALVLSMATMANAALTLGTSATQAAPGSDVAISISGDGSEPLGIFFLGIALGNPGALSVDNAVISYGGSDTSIMMFTYDDLDMSGQVNSPFVFVSLNDVPPPGTNQKPLTGTLVSSIKLTMGTGPATLILYQGDATTELGRVTVTTPEPVTVGLLGLGTLFLRRRK